MVKGCIRNYHMVSNMWKRNIKINVVLKGLINLVSYIGHFLSGIVINRTVDRLYLAISVQYHYPSNLLIDCKSWSFLFGIDVQILKWNILCCKYVHVHINHSKHVTTCSEDDTEEHFAGFLSKAVDRNIDDETQYPKSKKEAMAEVVTNSKIQKVRSIYILYDTIVC